jgi:hypothetical protein
MGRVGSLIALPLSRFRFALWRVPLPTLLVGIYGLFGFHFLLFMALRNASEWLPACIEDNAKLLVRSYAKLILRKVVVRSQASLAACASKRGVVSLLNPCCTPA